jgi:hypothetical protein
VHSFPEEKMKIEIASLTETNLADVPEWESHPFSCKYCIYWEFPEECIDPTKEKKEDIFKKKLKWLKNVTGKFGDCGKILYVDGKNIGFAEHAPPEFLPHSKEYDSGPPSDDTVLISCLFIPKEEFRKMELGSMLLKSIIFDLRKSRIKSVETFARKGNPNNPSGPLEFYLKNGFKIYKNDLEFPLVRLDL